MAPLPSRKSLESMKRVDLQRLCKDYGVRANLKSEALINLLLDTLTPHPPQSVRRSVSTKLPSRAGPSRVSSMIVHDISEEECDKNGEQTQDEALLEQPQTPPVRTRKAKELQTRLGVGKPVVAGGQGPRAVTRASGPSRGKREKSSRMMKPMESPIEEESEPGSVPQNVNGEGVSPPPNPEITVPTADLINDNPGTQDVKQIVEDAIRPLQDRIRNLESEVNQIHSIKSDIAELQLQVADVCKTQTNLTAELVALHELSELVGSLKEEIKQLTQGVASHSPSRPSTPTPNSKGGPGKHAAGFELPSAFRGAGAAPALVATRSRNQSNSAQSAARVSETILGKRPRDSLQSSIRGVSHEAECPENELPENAGPAKKRQRMTTDGDAGRNSPVASSSRVTLDDDEQVDSSSLNRAIPTFTVFRGSPPPTDHLPDFFRADSPPNTISNLQGMRTTGGVPTSSANAAENQPHPFGFSFLPISSTPHNAMYMPSFPYPEPPQSPSPAGPSTGAFFGRHHDERTDIFQPFGFPSPVRSSRHYSSQDDRGGFINPAALQQEMPRKEREVTSNDVAAGLGLTAVRTVSSSEAASGPGMDPLPSKRTMYGTELEGDTRFGDFGVEGVASGFWTTGKF